MKRRTERINWPELLFRAELYAAEILGVFAQVDQRLMAADGPVTPTEQEINATELRRIYLAALRIERLGMTHALAHGPGVCRFCECTAQFACDLDGDTCSWANATQTVCTNPACLAEAKLQRPRSRERRKKGGRK